MSDKPIKIPGPDHPITITPFDGKVVVRAAGQVIAETTHALTLKEASYPAVYYIPRADADMKTLEPSEHETYCPYKGEASYFSLPSGEPAGTASGLMRRLTTRCPRSRTTSPSIPTR